MKTKTLALVHTSATLVPIFVAVSAIAIVGNASAVRRLMIAARTAPTAPPVAPPPSDSTPDVERVSHEVIR